MAASTTLSISWGSGPTTTTIPIPANVDYSQATRNIFIAGGFWYTPASGPSQGVLSFVPVSQITSVTAQ
ncbi:MAG: hypothetical protein WAL95_04875 [Candidatus Acidiferrales bacterium]